MTPEGEPTSRRDVQPAPETPDRYPNLGTRGVSVSSSSSADVSIQTSKLEGWLIASLLLALGCISMGVYLIVLRH
ncbi:MAG: hypothetical protein ACREN7_03400 [Candidatus Dormibacteria bacterium]